MTVLTRLRAPALAVLGGPVRGLADGHDRRRRGREDRAHRCRTPGGPGAWANSSTGAAAVAERLTEQQDFRLEPEKSPHGPVSLVISAADRRALLLRNGVEIGRARVSLRDPASPLGTHAFVLTSEYVDMRPTRRCRARNRESGLRFPCLAISTMPGVPRPSRRPPACRCLTDLRGRSTCWSGRARPCSSRMHPSLPRTPRPKSRS